MNFSFVHEFDIDVKGYWKIFLSPEFNKDLFAALKMKTYTRPQADRRRKATFIANSRPSRRNLRIPGFLQSIVKSTGYTEYDDLDWSTNVMKVRIDTNMFKDKFKMSGNYSVQPIGDGKRVRR